MKKRYLVPAMLIGMMATNNINAQTIDMQLNTSETDVTVTMDLQPILELQMTTPDQIDFVFDNINSYMSGITKYGATVLRVSSTVDWDLVAVGTSGLNESDPGTAGGATGSPFWDNPVQYKTPTATSINTIPLSSLELQQTPYNPATLAPATTTGNYNSPFGTYSTGALTNSLNAIEVGDQTQAATGITMMNWTAVTGDRKAIAGVVGSTAAGGSVSPGSYLNTNGSTYTADDFKYTISYRILPGLPAIFPMRDIEEVALPGPVGSVGVVAGSYANPGVYTMEVRYILTEDL